jgi:ribonuclease R
VEGLLHVTELGNDYFHYDKAHHEMVGERTHVKYRLGDRVTIKVARVDLETTKIDFSLVKKLGSLEKSTQDKDSQSAVHDKSATSNRREAKPAKPKTGTSKKPKTATISRKSKPRKKR